MESITETCGYFSGLQTVDAIGRSPLHYAALAPNGEHVHSVVERPADTAAGGLGAAVWLMQRGALKDSCDNDGNTAADLCSVGSRHVFEVPIFLL